MSKFGDKLKDIGSKLGESARDGKFGPAVESWAHGVIPMDQNVQLDKNTKGYMTALIGALVLIAVVMFMRKK
jgi:uncharacterized membrane protein YeaQ/YmgE (transglycosylase-associated protein family)